MRVLGTGLPGVLRLETRVFHDERGHFRESWNLPRYVAAGVPERFVQDNVSWSRGGVLRGLHLQLAPFGQGKLISVLRGKIWDVAVDLRPASESFGRWTGVALTAEGGEQLYIPDGFAHGFLVTSDEALVAYKCTEPYHPESERTLLWNDPDLAIEWPLADPMLSEKDRAGSTLRELRPSLHAAPAAGGGAE